MALEQPPFALAGPAAKFPQRLLAAAAAKLSGLTRLQGVQRTFEAALGERAAEPTAWLAAVREWLALEVDLPAAELARVPAAGAAIVVAEHPTGAMEGVLLLDLLLQRRGDVRVLANHWLARLPALRGLVHPIDLYRRGNTAALRGAIRHLQQGGLLLVFPAGEVARRRPGSRLQREAPWQEAIARLQRGAAAPVVPIHVAARNPAWFHLAGSLHRHLRTALLARALLAQRGAKVAVRIGHPIPAAQLERFAARDAERIAYLQLRTVRATADPPCTMRTARAARRAARTRLPGRVPCRRRARHPGRPSMHTPA